MGAGGKGGGDDRRGFGESAGAGVWVDTDGLGGREDQGNGKGESRKEER